MQAGKTICLVSPKGGSGKTITSTALAKVFAFFGVKTLLVDGDAATNGLTLLNINKIRKFKKVGTDKHFGIFDAAANSNQIDVTILPFEDEEDEEDEIALIPATYTMLHTEHVEVKEYRKALDAVNEKYRNQFHAIIIDAQAGSDKFTRESVDVSDIVIIVSEYDPVSTDGVDRLKVHFHDVFAKKEVWTLYNKVLADFVPSLRQRSEIESTLPPISWDAEVVKAFAHRRTALDFDNLNPYTLAIVQIAQHIIGTEINEKVNEWKTHRTEVAEQPVREKFEHINEEIDQLERAKVRNKVSFAAALVVVATAIFSYLAVSSPDLFADRVQPIDSTRLILMFSGLGGLMAFAISVLVVFFKYGATKSNVRIEDLRRLREKYSALVSSRDTEELRQLSDLWSFLGDRRK